MFDYDGDLIDESDVITELLPVVSDEEFARWAEELDGSAAPSATDVLAAGEALPITPTLVAQLAALTPAALDDDGRVSLCVAWSRVRNYAEGMLGQVVAAQVAAPARSAGPRTSYALRRSD
jgi:hypothetical protein